MLLHRFPHLHEHAHEGAFFRPGRHGHGRGRFGFGGPRRRGDTKFEILAVLAEGPRHGYDVMLEIERRTGMKPSPGSVYPTLQALEEGEFVRGRESDGKRVYEITDSGRALLTERPASAETDGDPDDMPAFGRALLAGRSVLGAAKEVLRTGDVAMVEKTTAILERAKREIYSLLATSE